MPASPARPAPTEELPPSSPDESGVRRIPEADGAPEPTPDAADLTEQVDALLAEPLPARPLPPPVPPEAKGKRRARRPAVERVDFDAVLASFPPAIPGPVRAEDDIPGVPGIPRISYLPPDPGADPERRRAAARAVLLVGAAATGALLALL